MAITQNAQIKFKHGTQTNLDALRLSNDKTKIEVGTFYLTNDTHRLYVGVVNNNVNEIVPVNEGITTYASTSALPGASMANAGQFAYLSDTHILAVSNGKNWVQINHDSDTLYEYEGLVNNVEDENKVTVTQTLTAINNTSTTPSEGGDDYPFTFTLEGKDGIILEANSASGTVSIYGSTLGFQMMSGNAGASLVLKDAEGNVLEKGGVDIERGDNIKIQQNASGTGIKISADDTTLDGELTHATTGEVGQTTGDKLGFSIWAEDSQGQVSGGHINPIIEYGNNKKTVNFKNGKATLDVYTKAEVDSLRSAFDAMEYKGVVSNTPSGSQIKIGYTWKASSKFNISQKDRNDETKTETLNVNVGDLIIANVRPGKTEESTGYLSSANIYWEVVPSGNEDTTYTVETLAYGIEIKETPLGGASTPIGSISIKGDANVDSNNDGDEDDVGVITVTSAAQDSDQNLTVSHKKANRIDAGKTTQSVNNPAKTTKSTVSTQVITVIDAGVENTQNGIETDEYGHVKKVHTKAFTIHDTNAELTNVKTQAAVSNSAMAAITVGATLTRSDNDEDSLNDSVYLESNNENIQLSVGSAATKSIAFSLVWGSFDTPAGDMTIN